MLHDLRFTGTYTGRDIPQGSASTESTFGAIPYGGQWVVLFLTVLRVPKRLLVLNLRINDLLGIIDSEHERKASRSGIPVHSYTITTAVSRVKREAHKYKGYTTINTMLALALYDYINDAHEAHSSPQPQQQQQLISFQRGTVLDVLQSNGGWSYGRIVQKPINENPFTSSSNDSIGWFPTSYVSRFDGPSTTAFSSVDSVSKVTNSEPKANAVVPDHTETSQDDDDGFYGTPMGGYIDPQDEADDSNNNTQRSNTNDDRDGEVLPPGVSSVPVPHRRQLRVVTIPKNIVNNIATTTGKVTNRLHRRQNRSSTTTTSPAVYVSPS